MIISPIQLIFDSLDLVLLRKQSSRIDVGGDLSACPGERLCCVEIEAALLQLGRAPILIDVATMTPYVRRVSVPRIRISARHCRTGRGAGWFAQPTSPTTKAAKNNLFICLTPRMVRLPSACI